MAKYSTGRSSGGSEGTCELCGATADSLAEATIAGATLSVCPDCRPHDDSPGGGSTQSEGERERRREAARNAARASGVWDGDSSRWEREGTDYDDDPLPYLVSGYGDRVREARRDAGYQLPELADEMEIPEADLLAVEQGRAARADVGGSTIAEVEAHLGIEITEE